MDDFDDQIKQTTKNPWYAVRTFNCQELKISDFLKERKKVHFVPMTYVEKEKEGKTRKMLVPVVHNLVFLMTEFRILCDPDFKDTLYITHEEAEAKPGKNVRIIHGPFAGITGKLHRARGGYYLIKTLAGVGVMMRISRWYCEVTE